MTQANRTPTTLIPTPRRVPSAAFPTAPTVPEHTPPRRAIRRRFLLKAGATVATALGVTAAVLSPDPDWSSAVDPDTELLALCAAFHAHQDAAQATEDEAAMSAALDRGWDVQEQLRDVHPRTPAGVAAKAAVASRLLDSVGETPCEGDALHFVHVLLAHTAGVPYELEEQAPLLELPAQRSWPDAELLAACAAADAVQHRIDALYTGPTRVEDDRERDRLLTPLVEEQEPFLEQVCDLEAQTILGLRARAVTLASWDKEALKPTDAGWNSYMVAALVRDLVAGARV